MGRKTDDKKKLYDEATLKLGLKFYAKSELPLEILYHLMSANRLHSFSIIVIQTVMKDFGSFLKKHKRKTDLLFKLDSAKGIYVLFCQETQVDGGFYFLQRLSAKIEEEGVSDVRASIVGVESTQYPIRDLMFIVLDSFVKVQMAEPGEEKILHRTVR